MILVRALRLKSVKTGARTACARAKTRVKMVDPAMNGLVVLHSDVLQHDTAVQCVDDRRAIKGHYVTLLITRLPPPKAHAVLCAILIFHPLQCSSKLTRG